MEKSRHDSYARAEGSGSESPRSPTDTTHGTETGERVYPSDPLHSDWSQEYSSLILSVFSLVGLIVLLTQLDGAPFTNWHAGMRITPNTAVSILSTTAKAALLMPVASCLAQLKWLYLRKSGSQVTDIQAFDNASGGPSGAFSLIWGTTKWGPLSITEGIIQAFTYFGCVIVIAAAAIDPFSQQLLSFKSIPVPFGGESSVPRSQTFLPNKSVADWKLTSVNPAAQPIINGGMLGIFDNLDTLSFAPFFCPGANCTFPTFTTLAVCSSCIDVTPQVSARHNCTPETYFNDNVADGVKSFTCTSQSPAGFHLTNGAFCDVIKGGWTYDALTTAVNFTSNLPMLTDLGLIHFDNSEEYMPGGQTDSGPCVYPPQWLSTLTANECKMSLCAQVFENWSYLNGSIQPGHVSGYVLSSTSLDGGSQTLVATTDSANGSGSLPPIPGNATFHVDSDVLKQVEIFLKSILQMNNTGIQASTVTEPFPSAYLLNAFYTGTADGPADILSRMADGMTYEIMQGPTSTHAYGEYIRSTPFFVVRYAWLTPLAALLFFTGILLFTTAWYTRRVGQRAWKGSLLPILYRPDMSRSGDGQHAMWTEGEREQRAGEIRQVVLLR